MKLVRHAPLRLVLQDLIPSALEHRSELLGRPHHTVVCFINKELLQSRNVFFYEKKAIFSAIFAPCQTLLLSLFQELC